MLVYQRVFFYFSQRTSNALSQPSVERNVGYIYTVSKKGETYFTLHLISSSAHSVQNPSIIPFNPGWFIGIPQFLDHYTPQYIKASTIPQQLWSTNRGVWHGSQPLLSADLPSSAARVEGSAKCGNGPKPRWDLKKIEFPPGWTKEFW